MTIRHTLEAIIAVYAVFGSITASFAARSGQRVRSTRRGQGHPMEQPETPDPSRARTADAAHTAAE